MYKIIAILSVWIRNFYLPNPFEPLENSIVINYLGIDIPIPSIFLNILAEPVLHCITYGLVGIYYSSKEKNPAKGSFLYLFFYCVHVGLLYLMSMVGFAEWAVIDIIVAYIAAHFVLRYIWNKICCGGV
ncbi:MAG: hypothetical protein J1F11_10360 [Oscillospiraceae bacterium]|nr:hypothetical protein [Oscillospiraceae bacterium]